MKLSIDLLSGSEDDRYSNWVSGLDTPLFYVSLPFRNFLLHFLTDSEPYYLLAYHNGQLVGALPTFYKRNIQSGGVLNSLPFFGSNGGVLIQPEEPDPSAIFHSLLDALHALALEKHAVASTVISSPLFPMEDGYEAYSQYTFRDERIGQLTPLPSRDFDLDHLSQTLMGSFHKKTRNSIRKAQTSGVLVRHTDELPALKALAEMHEVSMDAIGVPAKPWSVFLTIRDSFCYDRDYRVYVAERYGEVIGALLVFFYKNMAEYYIPATKEGARSFQPMSLLVFEAMQEAVRRGCRYWNWGGTGITAAGVYDFKKRWGTEDHKYYYYTRIYDENILKLDREEIVKTYPYFYVFPFNQVKK